MVNQPYFEVLYLIILITIMFNSMFLFFSSTIFVRIFNNHKLHSKFAKLVLHIVKCRFIFNNT